MRAAGDIGEEGALPLDSGEQVVPVWVEDYADDGLLVDGEAERDGYVGESVDEVQRPVNGVAYKCGLGR